MSHIRIVTSKFSADVRNRIPTETESFSPGEQVYRMHEIEGQTTFARGSDMVEDIKKVRLQQPQGKVQIKGDKSFTVASTVFEASTEEE